MNVEISKNLHGKTVAVAVSGGADSMALLHFVVNFNAFPLRVIALNVEHGIRGESSLRDTEFVKGYCEVNSIPLLTYAVDATKKAREDKITIEQAARALRYECFFDAIKKGNCDAILTAHHSGDNLESVLFNLFRGTGIKGLTGIKGYKNLIYRPLLKVTKSEITDYVTEHGVPFVDDETNFSDDYTRNFLRLNVIPKIKEIFPEAEKSVLRLSETLALEDEYLDAEADKLLSCENGVYYLSIPAPRALLARAAIKALNNLGLVRDYEKVHVDDICALLTHENGKTVVLPNNIRAVREYDRIALYKERSRQAVALPFAVGSFALGNQTITLSRAEKGEDLNDGLFIDADKVPTGTVLRFRETGDLFTKFGGGTKSLSDYMTDKKIPRKDRDEIPIIAFGKEVLAIKGVEISDKVRIDETTQNIIKIS